LIKGEVLMFKFIKKLFAQQADEARFDGPVEPTPEKTEVVLAEGSIRINRTEVAFFHDAGALQIDGCSSDGGYDWVFAISPTHFATLLEKLPSNEEDLGVDEIIQAIINSGLETSGLSMLCKEHEIPHHFQVYR
tara:strand:+ start:107 stop:508 length:402 start_codon:yes stop_codon:yes gene_type:complete